MAIRVTGETNGHTHRFVALRVDGKVQLQVGPGGSDGHVHLSEPKTMRKGPNEINSGPGGEDNHVHEVTLDVPLTRRQVQASRAALALSGFRETIMEAMEDYKDDLFDPKREAERAL